MNALEEKIKAFALDTGNIVEAIALMKVGHDKNDDALTIMSRILANALLRYHGMPVTGNDKN